MAKTQVSTQLKNDEFAKIFDEYRAKIDEITQKTTARIIQPADEEPEKAADKEAEKPEEAIAVSQQELMDIRAEVQRQAQKEASEIINEATTLYTSWPRFTPVEKRRLIESLIEKIVLDQDEIDITFSYDPSSEELTKRQRTL